jgi:ankyrin repeat protein
MSTPIPEQGTLTLPENPDLRHLRDQARDLHRAGEAKSLTDAQFLLARRYGFPSWPKLKAHVDLLTETGQLKAAIDTNNLARVQELMTRNPALHRAPLGYGKNGPLTWVAECRVPRETPTETRLAIARWMLENGSEIHQGNDGPLMRAALSDERIPMMELLVAYGADVNAFWDGDYPIICAPCEALAPAALRWLLEHGANPDVNSEKFGTPLSMVVGTYARNSHGKHACLEAFAESGFALSDTPTMALHRGRLDLLADHLQRDPGLLARHFSDAEIFPPAVGIKPGDGLTSTPLEGGTLLHLAVEFNDLEVARWLLENGADPNAHCEPDAEGFNTHTPLFHAVVLMGHQHTGTMTRLLLQHGADPTLRATLRKQFRYMGDPEKERMTEYRNVTPREYTQRFLVPEWVNEAALITLEN